MIYFIVNNTARTGKSRAIWQQMKEVLESRQVHYKAYQTKYAGHATELARKISSLPEERIYLITVGGDGTLNEESMKWGEFVALNGYVCYNATQSVRQMEAL